MKIVYSRFYDHEKEEESESYCLSVVVHSALEQKLITLKLPNIPAFGNCPHNACAHHFGHQFCLILIRSDEKNCPIVTALRANYIHLGSCGVKDGGLICAALAGVYIKGEVHGCSSFE